MCVRVCERERVHAERLVWANCKVLLTISIQCGESASCLPFVVSSSSSSSSGYVPGLDAGQLRVISFVRRYFGNLGVTVQQMQSPVIVFFNFAPVLEFFDLIGHLLFL